jgi:hypothetical protein
MKLSGQFFSPAALPPGEGGAPGRMGGPHSRTLWRREKSLTPAKNGTSVNHPLARRYSDWAIPRRYWIKGDYNLYFYLHVIFMAKFEYDGEYLDKQQYRAG